MIKNARGRLSYSKARALTRIADRRTEGVLLDFAIPATASMVEDQCRQLRNAQSRVSTMDANRAHKARYLKRSIHEDGSMTINIQLPKEAADQVMVHVDESALLTEAGKSDLPAESVKRILCDGSLVPITKDKNGDPLNVGRKHRVVSSPLRRALTGRDKCCRYPGCTHEKYLNAHHVMHWVDGGETSLSNTLLLCGKHHRLLHEGGYTIAKNYEDKWYFRTDTGKVIPESPVFRADDYNNPSRDGFQIESDGYSVRGLVPLYAVG